MAICSQAECFGCTHCFRDARTHCFNARRCFRDLPFAAGRMFWLQQQNIQPAAAVKTFCLLQMARARANVARALSEMQVGCRNVFIYYNYFTYCQSRQFCHNYTREWKL